MAAGPVQIEEGGMTGKRILIVEDDLRLAALVREFLQRNGFEVLLEHRGDRALEVIQREAPDLVILDIMLPGVDGLTICRQARPSYRGPILMLTARGGEVDEIIGLEVGADDYVAKPVRPRVLLARIRSLLRRIDPTADGAPRRVEVGALVVDAAARAVELDGRTIDLTTAEFDLLFYMALHAGEPVSRDQLSRALRGVPHDGVDRTIDLRVSYLRSKLGDDGRRPALIKSVRGIGYQLVVG